MENDKILALVTSRVFGLFISITCHPKTSWLKEKRLIFFLQWCGLAGLVLHVLSADLTNMAAFSWEPYEAEFSMEVCIQSSSTGISLLWGPSPVSKPAWDTGHEFPSWFPRPGKQISKELLPKLAQTRLLYSVGQCKSHGLPRSKRMEGAARMYSDRAVGSHHWRQAFAQMISQLKLDN